MTAFDPGSRNVLTWRDVGRFPSNTLLDRVGRALCAVDCLPRKELYESWEVARRIRRRFRGGRVVDVASGHGLVALLMLILDDTSEEAIAIDPKEPPSAAKVGRALVAVWPRIEGRVRFTSGTLSEVAPGPNDLLVCVHGCGAITDDVLTRAIRDRCRVAVLPCCHDTRAPDPLTGWLEPTLAVDVARAHRLRAAGFRVRAELISEVITPKNRLLIAEPT